MTASGTLAVRLAYRPPLHGDALLEFLGQRAVPGVEEVVDGTYRRGLRLPHGPAVVALTPQPGHVAATLRLADLRDLAPAVARCRRLLDLDADPVAVDAALAGDPALAAAVEKEPGVRVPRAVDGFEMVVRAVVGQQISVAGARTILARLVAAALAPPDDRVDDEFHGARQPRDETACGGGELTAFPSPEEVLALPDDAFPVPAARRETIRAVARAVCDGTLDLDLNADREETARRLLALPGLGPWTVRYVAMRGFGDPDVFLPTDLAVRRGAAVLGLPDRPDILARHATRWRPWRSYAVMRLWRSA